MFALKARPASLASRRSHNARRSSSQIVRVAEFERKTSEKIPKISVPAVDGGETPLDILNDGADAFAELVALNKPKQSVNRPQKVRLGRRGDGNVEEKRMNESQTESGGMAKWHADRRWRAMMMRATLTPFRDSQFSTLNHHPQEVNFRQNPTFEDCYPSSTKEYKEVVHEGTGTVLRVRC